MSERVVTGVFSDVRVLDLSRVRAGPTCVRMLADFGAEVLRIEPPPGLDANDNMFAEDRLGGDFQNLNRNKRSLTLNLKVPEGLALLRTLVQGADVVVENWRPDVKRRLGLDYDALKAINPRIILVSISGFGQDGPYAGRPGFDQVIQGMGGGMSVTGHAGGGPVRVGYAVADSSTGLYAALGVMAALYERERSGIGQWVTTSLLHSQIAMLDFQAARYLNERQVPVQCGNDHPSAAPMGLYRASDGAVNIAVAGDGNWRRFCGALGRSDWMDDPRFATNARRISNRAELQSEIEAVLNGSTVASWVELINRAGVPAGPVYTIDELFDDPHVRDIKAVESLSLASGRVISYVTQPVSLSRTPPVIETPAPTCGEHTAEILAELGLNPAEIARLREEKVV